MKKTITCSDLGEALVGIGYIVVIETKSQPSMDRSAVLRTKSLTVKLDSQEVTFNFATDDKLVSMSTDCTRMHEVD